jgi:hypothetical protein
MRSRFKKIWCEWCEFLVYPGQCEHGRTEIPAAWTPNSPLLLEAAAAEAKKIGRPLRVTMLTDLTFLTFHPHPPPPPPPPTGLLCAQRTMVIRQPIPDSDPFVLAAGEDK